VIELEIAAEPGAAVPAPVPPPEVAEEVETETEAAELASPAPEPPGAVPRPELPAAGGGPAPGGGAGGGEGGVVVPPVIVAMAWPEYPAEARRAPSVPIVIAVHVTASGEVDDVRLENATDCPPCERAAVASAWRLRFSPGTRDGEPAAMWTRFPVTFKRR
jgi:TonB family protein